MSRDLIDYRVGEASGRVQALRGVYANQEDERPSEDVDDEEE